jgi:Tfp pilus assembly protein PilE
MRPTLIPRKSRGFTRMALGVAIAICGVLSAIAIPNFLSYRQTGLMGAATGDLKKNQRKVQDRGHGAGFWPYKRPAVKTTQAFKQLHAVAGGICALFYDYSFLLLIRVI